MNGFVGVDIFVISGYLIAEIVEKMLQIETIFLNTTL